MGGEKRKGSEEKREAQKVRGGIHIGNQGLNQKVPQKKR